MSTVLVLGGAGYIGSHTLLHLRTAGVDAFAYDNLSVGHRAAVLDADLVAGDLADGDLLERTLRSRGVDAVFHFAACCYVGESVENPEKYYRNNVVNAITLLSAMRRAGVSLYVFSSTCATFGNPLRPTLAEDHPQDPINPYGRTKLMMEQMLPDWERAYGLRSVCLRYFNAAGADPSGRIGEDHEPETHLIPLVLRAALGLAPPVRILGTDYDTPDGTCIRDYIHVNDLAEAHRLALEHLRAGGASGHFNLGNGQGYSVREVIAAAERVTGRTVPAVTAPRRAGDPPRLVADWRKARERLGWTPRFGDLDTIIETAWRWHRDHPEGYAD